MKTGHTELRRGRPPLDENEPTLTMSVRMTRQQREAVESFGGAGWIRAQIDSKRLQLRKRGRP